MSLVHIERKSPNFDERRSDVPLNYLILHYTGMKTEEEALSRMSDKDAKVSAHYMIGEDGKIYRLVDESMRAWHAGKSFWRGITDVNSASIGIELANPGHEFGYRSFTAAQIYSLKELLRDIYARHGFGPQALLAHSDIAPTRKEDPGELFPWKELAAEGFGVWPNKPSHDQALPEKTAKELLENIGYDCSDMEAAILAFQRRFYPENLSGEADAKTVEIMKAVERLF